MNFNRQKIKFALIVIAIYGGFRFLQETIMPKFMKAHYTIARGCKGHIKIITNRPDGVEPLFVNGTYIFYISRNGVLKLKHSNPINTWVEQSASFEDGTPIPMPPPSASRWKKGQLALITGSVSYEVDLFFLGTREEYEKAFWKLPP